MKPTTKNFLKEVARQKGTKTNLKAQKVALESVQDLLSLTEEADINFRSFDDMIVDWTDRYEEIQNEGQSLYNLYKTWQDSTDVLEEAANQFYSKSEDIGINAEDIPAYGSAERTINAYRDDSNYEERLSVAANMPRL